MAQAETIPTISRRRFLSILGLAGAATTAATVAVVAASPRPKIEDRLDPYKRPLEYFLDMQAIGWTPVAMFHRLKDGGIHCMGVKETTPDNEWAMKTWDKFHAIQRRCPAKREADLPSCNWWREVWQFLYDRGLREDVTPKSKL